MNVSRRESQKEPSGSFCGYDLERLNDVDHFADVRATIEVCFAGRAVLYYTSNFREKCMIAADTNILAGKHFCAALSYDYCTRYRFLTIGKLDTKVLRI